MSPSESEEYLKMWTSGISKTFQYTDHEFISGEYVKIVKYFSVDGDTYLVDGSSTTFPNNKTKITEDEMKRYLTKQELVPKNNYGYESPRTLKTGGCECGAFKLKDSTYLHSKWCPMYKKDPGGLT